MASVRTRRATGYPGVWCWGARPFAAQPSATECDTHRQREALWGEEKAALAGARPGCTDTGAGAGAWEGGEAGGVSRGAGGGAGAGAAAARGAARKGAGSCSLAPQQVWQERRQAGAGSGAYRKREQRQQREREGSPHGGQAVAGAQMPGRWVGLGRRQQRGMSGEAGRDRRGSRALFAHRAGCGPAQTRRGQDRGAWGGAAERQERMAHQRRSGRGQAGRGAGPAGERPTGWGAGWLWRKR